jgi:hypothetical protein
MVSTESRKKMLLLWHLAAVPLPEMLSVGLKGTWSFLVVLIATRRR